MSIGAGQASTAEWVESMLRAFTPWADLVATPENWFDPERFMRAFDGGEVPSAPANPALHFKQFLELLQSFAGSVLPGDAAADLGPLVPAWLGSLRAAIDLLRGTKPFTNTSQADVLAALDRPVLGPAREHYRAWARLARLVADERAAAGALRDTHLEMLSVAIERLEHALAQTDDADITSVRGLYDLWVGIADGAYRETALGEDYARQFAALINARVALADALRQRTRALFEQWVVPHDVSAGARDGGGDVQQEAPAAPAREVRAPKPRRAPRPRPAAQTERAEEARPHRRKRRSGPEFDISTITRTEPG